MILETAQEKDLSLYMEILENARLFQRAQGFVQWPDNYPAAENVLADIREGKGFALKQDGLVAGYLYIGFDGDPAYPAIKGAWRYDAPYAVVHRIAIGGAFRGQNLADEAFRLVEDYCKAHGMYNLRIDTDEQNKRMRHILEKNGFVCCGTVIQGGGDRLAFDKWLGEA